MAFRDSAGVVLAGVLGFGLSGCASINYIVNEYRGIEVREVKMPDDTYRVFDKPAESKMMVTSSLGSAAGQGFAKGLTFGAAQTEPPKPLFEAAALQFLTDSGRPGCRVLDAYLLASPQWEVKYDCSPVLASIQPAPSGRTGRQKSSPR